MMGCAFREFVGAGLLPPEGARKHTQAHGRANANANPDLKSQDRVAGEIPSLRLPAWTRQPARSRELSET